MGVPVVPPWVWRNSARKTRPRVCNTLRGIVVLGTEYASVLCITGGIYVISVISISYHVYIHDIMLVTPLLI